MPVDGLQAVNLESIDYFGTPIFSVYLFFGGPFYPLAFFQVLPPSSTSSYITYPLHIHHKFSITTAAAEG